jgi:hypothetical protein
MERDDLLDILMHPNPERYGGQRIFVVRREDYVYLVPFVEDEHTVFLKTIIPSRKATRGAAVSDADREPVTQVRNWAAQGDLRNGPGGFAKRKSGCRPSSVS